MANAGNWPDGYSPSTQAALRFAWAAAAVRLTHGSPRSDSLVTLDDVLVGTLLAHPGTSEGEVCFRHFGLVAGQVLADGYPRLTTDSLNRRLDALVSDDMPPLGDDALEALDIASSRSTTASDGKIHLPFLWYGILGSFSSEMGGRLGTAFAARNTDLTAVHGSTERWLGEGKGQPYREWLESDFPDPQSPTSVVRFKADTTMGASTTSGDLLQIGREVDAFAYLLASKDTRPPLAVGLFGAWGSGKSFFMNSVQRRVEELTADTATVDRPQGLTPFWKRIIAIEFNAWHYVEGDLLASLIDHIFTELRRSTYGRSRDPATAEEEGWLRNLEANQRVLDDKRRELDEAEAELTSLQAEVIRLEAERDEAVSSIDDQVANVAIRTSMTAVADALRHATGRKEIAPDMTVDDASRQLDEARTESRRALGAVSWVGRSPWLTFMAVVSVIAVPVVVGTVADSSLFAAVAGVAAFGLQLLGGYTAYTRSALDRLDRARAMLDMEIADIKEQHRSAIEAKKEEAESKREEIKTQRTKIDDLETERARLQAEIETPAGIRIRRFLDERIGSGDYRNRLGVPAIVRRDLARLTSYITRENDRVRNDQQQRRSEVHDLNRIVLYIDDLDRCPEDKVIKVLQAVHLLLAFELFIVVVAVDSKWLSHALMTELPALAKHEDPSFTGDHARPRDYLEKIFQVPFFVRPLGDDGRRSILRGLLGDQLRLEGAGAVGGGSFSARRVGDREAKVLDEQVRLRQSPASLATEAFSMSRSDLDFVESLAPVLGNTPRAVKRFVNLYQLLRVMLASQASVDAGPVPDAELATFLLAVGNSEPDFAATLLDQPPTRLGELVEVGSTLRAIVPKAIGEWLAHPDRDSWKDVGHDRIAQLAETVERFSFGS